jgi:hypothetical protein
MPGGRRRRRFGARTFLLARVTSRPTTNRSNRFLLSNQCATADGEVQAALACPLSAALRSHLIASPLLRVTPRPLELMTQTIGYTPCWCFGIRISVSCAKRHQEFYDVALSTSRFCRYHLPHKDKLRRGLQLCVGVTLSRICTQLGESVGCLLAFMSPPARAPEPHSLSLPGTLSAISRRPSPARDDRAFTKSPDLPRGDLSTTFNHLVWSLVGVAE